LDSERPDNDVFFLADNGRVVENGSPNELLNIPGGIFRRLLRGEEVDAVPRD
jgi:ABC-type multidrug transport system fused ATPase/permease subunit